MTKNSGSTTKDERSLTAMADRPVSYPLSAVHLKFKAWISTVCRLTPLGQQLCAGFVLHSRAFEVNSESGGKVLQKA